MATFNVEKYFGNIKISFKAPPADHVNSKGPPFIIQHLHDDPPPPHISSYMLYKG